MTVSQPTREFTPINPARNLANKRRVQAAQGDITQAPQEQLGEAIAAAYHEDADFRATHPVNHVVGRAAIQTRILGAFAARAAGMSNGGRASSRVVSIRGGNWSLVMANISAPSSADWFGIPATGQPLIARYCEAA